MRIVGLVFGGTSDFDNQYVVEYDPASPGRSDGQEMAYSLMTTPDINHAARYPDVMAALCVYQQFADGHEDSNGDPYRPLTQYNVEFEPVESEPSRISDRCPQ
jgi:hypothetical protein